MATISTHDDGMPDWIDVMVETPEQHHELRAFLSALFDWSWEVGTPEMGYYSLALHNGAPVLGLGQSEGSHGRTTTYFATSNIDDAIKKATDLGATVTTPAMEVMELGSMAVLVDPTGASFGLWQPGTFNGFGVMYEPNAPGWFDQASDDPKAAATFYAGVTGHEVNEPETDMRVLQNGDQWFASISQAETGGAPRWMPIFVVDSLQRIHEVVPRHGGAIVIDEMPVPGSAICVFSEPVTGTLMTVMSAGDHPS